MNTPNSEPRLLVVRRFGSDKTHVMKVAFTTDEIAFGATYQRPSAGRAECGVSISDGVVMRTGTKTRCKTCRHITGVAVQSDQARTPSATFPQEHS